MSYTEFDLRTATYRGERVVTFASLDAALRKLAADYDEDGYDEIGEAFRLFADTLTYREGA